MLKHLSWLDWESAKQAYTDILALRDPHIHLVTLDDIFELRGEKPGR